MVRIKRGNVARKSRKKVLGIAKGYVGSHSRLFRVANQQVSRALEDKERLIKVDINELDKNIDRIDANIKMVGESAELSEVLNMLITEKVRLNGLLDALTEVRFKESEKYKLQ